MDLRFVAARAIFALGSGAAVLLVTGNLAAAALLAFSAPFVGHFTARLNHPAYFAVTYVPWVLAALALGLRAATPRAKARATVLLACATWLQLVASTPKEGLIVLAAAYLAGLVAALRPSLRWSGVLGRLDVLFGAGLLALLLGAPHWLVFLDTLSRSWTAYDAPEVQLASWPQAVAFVLGAVAPGQPFTGGHPLLIVAAACACARPRALLDSGLGLGALVALLAGIAVAFGAVPPALIASTPLLRNIHHVWDAFLAATIPLLLLVAGIGLAAVLDERHHHGGWRTTATTILSAAACAWVVPGVVPQAFTVAGLLAVGGAAIVVLALRWAGPGRSLLVGLGAAAALAAGGLHLDTGVKSLDDVLTQPRHRADLLAPSPAIRALKAAAGSEPFRVMPIEAVLVPGTQGQPWTLEGTGGPDALRLPEMDSLGEAGGLERTHWIGATSCTRTRSPTPRASSTC